MDECDELEYEYSGFSYADAVTFFSKCINSFAMQVKVHTAQVLLLRRIRKLAAIKAQLKHKQKCITVYFG